MVSFFDYLSIGFYFIFVLGVGVAFARKNKNTSDYFRGGGIMPWWLAGISAWMASFSAWTFTGAAGKIYENGPYVLCLYYASIIPLLIVLVYTCYRFRRMRVVTPLEAVRLRFGAQTQQFYTWIRLPFLLFFSGVGLNAVGVFMSAVFGVDLTITLLALGAMVTFVSLVGGAFGVAASDFVQMFLVVSVALVTGVLAVYQPSVGGLGHIVDKLPSAHLHWGEFARPEFIALWVLSLGINGAFSQNSMENSTKFLMARSDRHARLMLIFPIVGTIVGPLIWMLPPLVSSITHPDLAAQFPQLKYPQEAAFLSTALDVLPQGMLGLLICGIFGATLTNMDSGMNQGVGIFVRNFYLPVINPLCSERKLLIISKISTACFGVVIITIAVAVNHFRTLNLFDLLNQLGISLWLPLAVPLALGLFYKRTPAWSSWSTVLIGLAASLVIKFFTNPAMFATIPYFQGPFKAEEVTQYYIFATVITVSIVSVGWFFFTSMFYEKSPAEHKQAVEEFFNRLKTPIESLTDEQVKENHSISGLIGKLSLIFGTFVTLLAAAPNSLAGRLCFVFCGGSMLLTGWLLVRHYRRHQEIASKELAPSVNLEHV